MFQMYTKVILLYIHIKVRQTETTISDITYMWNLKNRCKWNLFSRSRLADAGKQTHGYPRGKTEGRMHWGFGTDRYTPTVCEINDKHMLYSSCS